MALIEFDLPWDSQPQEAVPVDTSNPLAHGLAAFVYPHADASFSALGGRPGASAGSTRIATRQYSAGRALAWNTQTSSQYIDTPCPGAALRYNGREFTLYARFQLLGERSGATPTNFSGALSIFGVDVNGTGNGIAIACGSGVSNIAAGLNLGANRNTPDLALSTGVTYDAFLRCTTGQNAVLSVIGVATTVSTSATGVVNLSVTPTASAKAVTGCRISTSGPGSAALFVGALWWRNLSDAEILQIAENPWQVLESQSIPIYVSAAVPTLPTLSLARAKSGSITSSGWVSQITAS